MGYDSWRSNMQPTFFENWKAIARIECYAQSVGPQRSHDASITSLLRENDITTSFERNTDVVIVSCARWFTSNFSMLSLFHL